MVVNDTFLDDRDSGIIALGGDKLLLTWFHHDYDYYYINRETFAAKHPLTLPVYEMYPTIPEDKRSAGSYVRLSHDNGWTWDAPVKVPINTPHGPVLLHDGVLLYLGKQRTYDYTAKTEEKIYTYQSTDGGKEWSYLGTITLCDGLEWKNVWEPHLIELRDGRILGIIRVQGVTDCGGLTMYQTISEDRGKTWTPMKPLGTCGSVPHLMRHSSGAIILTYCRRYTSLGRFPNIGQRALISYDDGETWEDEYIVTRASVSDLGYPSSTELPDGSILTVYYERYGEDPVPSLLCSRWRLDRYSEMDPAEDDWRKALYNPA